MSSNYILMFNLWNFCISKFYKVTIRWFFIIPTYPLIKYLNIKKKVFVKKEDVFAILVILAFAFYQFLYP